MIIIRQTVLMLETKKTKRWQTNKQTSKRSHNLKQNDSYRKINVTLNTKLKTKQLLK